MGTRAKSFLIHRDVNWAAFIVIGFDLQVRSSIFSGNNRIFFFFFLSYLGCVLDKEKGIPTLLKLSIEVAHLMPEANLSQSRERMDIGKRLLSLSFLQLGLP